jgi:hypothetical protein
MEEIEETPFPERLIRMDDTGEPYTGDTSPPFETKDQPPFATFKFKPSSMIEKGVSITLRITPYAIMLWVFAPTEVKYQARRYVRYLPWAIKYAVWWMKQNA